MLRRRSGLSVLVETVMLASVASMAGSLPAVAVGQAATIGLSQLFAVRAPWQPLGLGPAVALESMQWAPDCGHLRGELLLPCSPAEAGPDIDDELPASSYVPSEVRLPS